MMAGGAATESCNCLWLGAGGSGKTYAYAKVLRSMFRRYFGDAGYIVGAPTHAAVRLLGNPPKIGKNMLKHAKTRPKKSNCNCSASATYVIQEMSGHTRTWNLEATLGTKSGKVNQQYRHTKVNQRVLDEKVPKENNKNQIPSLRSQLSNHVQSVASPQYKHP